MLAASRNGNLVYWLVRQIGLPMLNDLAKLVEAETFTQNDFICL